MIITTSLLAALAASAHADDKYHPGTMCAGRQPFPNVAAELRAGRAGPPRSTDD